MKFLEVTRGRMGLSACVPVRYARLLSSAQELATWPQVTMCLKGALTHADRCAHESPVPPHIRLDCSVSRPQQKRTRTAPRWGLPTSRTVRKYFCCLCHPEESLCAHKLWQRTFLGVESIQCSGPEGACQTAFWRDSGQQGRKPARSPRVGRKGRAGASGRRELQKVPVYPQPSPTAPAAGS